ncbi:MAG: hypothetical protein KA105_08140 [Caulobacter sp.]|nr:hypothetical protein [Caulobacter sp.]
MARREWLRFHFAYENGALTLEKLERAARPARPSPAPPGSMMLSVVGAGQLADSSGAAQADTCCAGAADTHAHSHYVFELMALPTDRVRLTYPGFSKVYALADQPRSDEPVRRAPAAEDEDIEKVRQAAAAGGWVIVALANAFTADNMEPFLRQVGQLEADLKKRRPFDHFKDRITVVPVRTPSPSNIPGDDSAFGHKVLQTRRFDVDQDAVSRLMTKHGFTHDRFQPLVVTNIAEYGGSGGKAAVVSMNPLSTEIAIHEIGHSEFGLSDEYSDRFDEGELLPFGPNVQRIEAGGFGGLKWRTFATTPNLPTLRQPSSLSPLTPGFDGVVGAFEGGHYQTSGVYRPQLKCAMRGSGEAFCVVCRDVIGERLSRLTGLPKP